MKNNENTDVKIYVVCHKPSYVANAKTLYPIQVGSEKAGARFPMLHDDEGDNISARNPDYCELTAIYWAWKNDSSDYVGLFHYRRYLALDSSHLKKQFDWWKHYYKTTAVTDEFVKKIGFDGEEDVFIKNYDMIVPKSSDLNYRNYGTFYELYSTLKKELDYAIDILLAKYPEYNEAVEKCKNGTKGYHSNMFIMKRNYFEEYCSLLFSVLDSMYDDLVAKKLVTEKKRIIGYIAEFLTGIFIEKKTLEKCNIKEVPGVYFKYTDGKPHKVKASADYMFYTVYRLLFPMNSKREKLLFKVKDSLHKRKG